jgi:dolichol-phosphate mannosyltransferase
VRARGYAFQVELTWRAAAAGARVVEVPIVFRERREGQSKLSGAIVGDAVVGLWALRWAGAAGGKGALRGKPSVSPAP